MYFIYLYICISMYIHTSFPIIRIFLYFPGSMVPLFLSLFLSLSLSHTHTHTHTHTFPIVRIFLYFPGSMVPVGFLLGYIPKSFFVAIK